ncbi:hypothetical protein EVAR_38615_1 [Eumeta japonica]|uniref:Uncharacterized protein n=1 Tax=Eumeta variegata TaxID=151549 RepID=A0A4C1WQU0_EUMVA|nr:hypothetical protein EVAR_38615_1 [Eumeta japonica]
MVVQLLAWEGGRELPPLPPPNLGTPMGIGTTMKCLKFVLDGRFEFYFWSLISRVERPTDRHIGDIAVQGIADMFNRLSQDIHRSGRDKRMQLRGDNENLAVTHRQPASEL